MTTREGREDNFKCSYCPEIPYVGEELGFDTEKKLASWSFAWDSGRVDEVTRQETFNQPLGVFDYFVMVPTIGCMMPGYMLAISRRHVYSFGELHADDLVQVEENIDRYVENLEKIFDSRFLVFEHGSGGPERAGGSCVRHAHLHCIPFSTDGIDWLREKKNFRELKSGYVELTDYRGKNYAFIDDGYKRYIWVDEIEPDGEEDLARGRSAKEAHLPGQWVRKMVGEYLGIELWDWASDSGYHNAVVTRTQILSSMERTAMREMAKGDYRRKVSRATGVDDGHDGKGRHTIPGGGKENVRG